MRRASILPHQIERLRQEALSHEPYSPYSGFQVNAAVLTKDGEVYGGGNVENVNYSLTVHAEQSAILNAILALHGVGPSRKFIEAVYVYCNGEKGFPCGGCRQFIHEFATDTCVVIVEDFDGVEQHSMDDLYPHAFGPEALGR